MIALAAVAGALVILVSLWDAFETILLPRRVSGRWRLSRVVQRGSWWFWSLVMRPVRARKRREYVLSLYAMLTMLTLFVVWGVSMIFGFALLQWAAGSRIDAASGTPGFASDLYLSGTTFFTLGLGDVAPISRLARGLAVLEAGTGFGFLAMALAYLPVLYQAFSRREAHITMLDEWAGSPPSALELLTRSTESGDARALTGFLNGWELWASELMESHLSYPILAYFRSQHDNQSWLSALTTVLDTCALAIVGIEGVPAWQARLTFAMARHTVVDLSQVFQRRPRPFAVDRLPPAEVTRLRAALAEAGAPLRAGEDAERQLRELRAMYEPYVHALSEYLLMAVPSWFPDPHRRYNWKTTAWERTGHEDAH
jgi:hypothetical protein